jgi:hypothetical protein
MLLRPMMTHSIPRVSTPVRTSISCTPAGVHGAKPSFSPMSSLPTLIGWKPSTSLAGLIRRRMVSESMCFGSGIWTRMPCTIESAFSRSTWRSSSSWVVVAGRRIVSLAIPASSHALPFDRT